MLRLDGALTMDTVAARLADGRALAGQGGFVVDFSGVTLPAGLRSLAQLYGVDELLPREEAAESI